MSSVTVDIYQAKTRLSHLVAPPRKIRFDVLKGQVKVAPDFDAPPAG